MVSAKLLTCRYFLFMRRALAPRGSPWPKPSFVPYTTASSYAGSQEDERTKGGIIIPDTAKEKPQQGEIVAVGPGAPDEKGNVRPLDVKPGDRVLFGKWSGTEVKIDGEELLIMKESDILGVLEDVAAKKKAA